MAQDTPTFVVVDPMAAAAIRRQKDAEELGGRQLDRADVPGGVYIGQDGRKHDAFGRYLDANNQLVPDQSGNPAGLRPFAARVGTAEELDAMKQTMASGEEPEPGTGGVVDRLPHDAERRYVGAEDQDDGDPPGSDAARKAAIGEREYSAMDDASLNLLVAQRALRVKASEGKSPSREDIIKALEKQDKADDAASSKAAKRGGGRK